MSDVLTLLAERRIVPVVVLDRADDARPLAAALAAASLPCAEITLRTPQSLAALEEACAVDGFVAGAGTVLTAAQARDAVAAGAQFLVSPGLSRDVVTVGRAADIPVLPGVVTATEILTARRLGLTALKFFPAATSGGRAALEALTAPFADIQFMPTGGITAATMADYLAIDAVFAVGGSWIATRELIAARDWAAITDRARDAVAAASTSRPTDITARNAS